MPATWIDISVPLRSGMVHWPGDPQVSIKRARALDRGDDANVSHLRMGAHTGTHMDAPLHFLARGKGIDRLPPEAVVGRARVIAIEDPESIKLIELARHRIRSRERILFKTRNSARCWKSDAFVKDYVYISPDAARFLAARGVQSVGIDYLSVGGFHGDGACTHRILLAAGIWIIEGLNLSRVSPGVYDLLCLPLLLTGGDGAPARALLRSRAGTGR